MNCQESSFGCGHGLREGEEGGLGGGRGTGREDVGGRRGNWQMGSMIGTLMSSMLGLLWCKRPDLGLNRASQRALPHHPLADTEQNFWALFYRDTCHVSLVIII